MLRKRSFTKRRGICRGPWSSMSRHAVTYRFRHEIKEFVPLPDYPRAAKPPAAHPKVPRPLSSGSSMDAPTDARDQTWPWVLRQRFGNQVHIGLAISGDTRRYTPPCADLSGVGSRSVLVSMRRVCRCGLRASACLAASRQFGISIVGVVSIVSFHWLRPLVLVLRWEQEDEDCCNEREEE